MCELTTLSTDINVDVIQIGVRYLGTVDVGANECTSSEHFGQKGSGFKRLSGSSGFLQATLF